MLDESTDGGANNDQVSDPVDDTSGSQEPKVISEADHQRALDDMHKYKKERVDLQAKLDDAEKKSKKVEEEGLRKNNNYKTLSERLQKEIDDKEAEHADFKQSYFDTKRYDAIEKEAIKAGMRDEALEDIGLFKLDGVEVEHTSAGRVIVNGSAEWVADLKKTKPYLFKQDGAPVFNGGGATPPIRDPKDVTAQDVNAARRKYKMSYSMQDKKVWHDLHQQFKQSLTK